MDIVSSYLSYTPRRARDGSAPALAGRALAHAHRLGRGWEHLAAVDDLDQGEVPHRENHAHDACARVEWVQEETSGGRRGYSRWVRRSDG